MKYFPKENTLEESQSFITKMQNQFKEKRYCYFAVDLIDTGEFIGFVGLSYQDYNAEFTPCVDIGWRIDKKHWHKGYATEAAKASLEYAFNNLQLEFVYSVAPIINEASIAVMKKLHMKFDHEFIHPFLTDNSNLNPCSVYKIEKTDFKKFNDA